MSAAPTIEQLVELLSSQGARGLGLDDLLTRREVRAALRCSWSKVDDVLARVPPIATGRWPLYRWRLVLAVVEPKPTPSKRAVARPTRSLPRMDV